MRPALPPTYKVRERGGQIRRARFGTSEDRVFAGIGRVKCDALIQSGLRQPDGCIFVRRRPAPEVQQASRATARKRKRRGSMGTYLKERPTLELCHER